MLAEKIQSIRNLFNRKLRELTAENAIIELEAKYKYTDIKRSMDTVPYVYYDRLLNYYKKIIPVVSQESCVAIYANNIRRITTINAGDIPETITWQRKTGESIDFVEIDIRVSVNIEQTLINDEIPFNLNPKLIRDRTRYTFILVEDLIQLDMTEVMETDLKGGQQEPQCKVRKMANPKYEVEVEFKGNVDQLDIFVQYVNDILQRLKGTNIIYTNKMKTDLNRDVGQIIGTGNYINKNKFVESRNIKWDDIAYGGIVGNQKIDLNINNPSILSI